MLKILFKKFNINRSFVFYSIVILLLSYKTYFHNYEDPNKLIWDETYHIASAFKYLDGVMFMESHPPLGKQIIAFGEYLLEPNKLLNTKNFLEHEKIKDMPKNFSYLGVRLFPALLAMLTAPLFYIILFLISNNALISFLFSLLFVFENGYIVHSRSAMLESSQIFFLLLVLAQFIRLSFLQKYISKKDIILMSLFLGLSLSVKISSLIGVLLIIGLMVKDFIFQKNNLSFLQIFLKYSLAPITIIFIFMLSFYTHGLIGQKVVKNKWYGASQQYKKIIQEKKTGDINNIFIIVYDNLKFMKKYQEGVPERKLYSKLENGSHPLLWPFGSQSISYRWDRKDGLTSYIYLIGNPVVWWLGIIGIFLALILVGGRYVFSLKIENKKYFNLLLMLLIFYCSYLFSMAMLTRVMYLYHYFIPLLFSLIISFTVFLYIFESLYQNRKIYILSSLVLFSLEVFVVYRFYSPLTYHQPISNFEFQARSWMQHWRLKNAQ